MSDSPKKTIRVPFEFGEIVYHRARMTKIAGVVVGFIAVPHGVKILVVWGNNIEQSECHFCELTTEYVPDFSPES